MKIYLYLLLWMCTGAPVCLAQRVTNVRAQAKGNIVTITYDLQGTIIGQLYNVAIFSSHNDKAQPLTQVRGDIGANLKPGTNKTIEWGSKKELGDFEGDISFEIRATLIFSPIRFTTPRQDAIYKRGKNFKITWLGAIASENLQLELYSDTTRQFEINRVINKGIYQWEIPLNAQPGKKYRLKISSVDKPDNFTFSNNFTIKRKTPTAWKVVPLGILTSTAVYFLLRGDKGTGTSVEEDLPLPPKPR